MSLKIRHSDCFIGDLEHYAAAKCYQSGQKVKVCEPLGLRGKSVMVPKGKRERKMRFRIFSPLIYPLSYPAPTGVNDMPGTPASASAECKRAKPRRSANKPDLFTGFCLCYRTWPAKAQI
jgi:hypothetical protein